MKCGAVLDLGRRTAAGDARYLRTSPTLRGLLQAQSFDELIKEHGDPIGQLTVHRFRKRSNSHHELTAVNQNRPMRCKKFVQHMPGYTRRSNESVRLRTDPALS